MKIRYPFQTISALLSVVAMAIVSMPVGAVITGSAHDFSNGTNFTWNTTGEICVVCHAPHNASDYTSGPLWNHTTSSATYALYNSVTPPGSDLQGTGFADPAGVSKLCLSCHDGSVALDSFGGATGTTFIDTNRNIGEVSGGTGNLANDHPVAFQYPDVGTGAGQDPELESKATITAAGLPLFGTSPNETLECATCHDVHNTNITGPSLLRIANSVADGGTAASGLCLTCHVK